MTLAFKCFFFLGDSHLGSRALDAGCHSEGQSVQGGLYTQCTKLVLIVQRLPSLSKWVLFKHFT